MTLTDLTSWGAALLIAVAISGGAMFAMVRLRDGRLRASRLTVGGVAPNNGQLGGKFAGLVMGVSSLGAQIAVRDPSQVSVLRAKLTQAGYFKREAVAIFLGVKAAAMVAATIGAVLLMPWALLGGGMTATAMAAALAVLAILGPDQVVKARRRKVELEIMDGFPDLLDLMVASVQAGLSIDAAVNRLGAELVRRHPNLAYHLDLLTLDLRAGRQRKEAWGAFAERLGIDEARALSTMLRQAEDMGASLGETLAVFADDMRIKRMLRAEEKAMALPAKLMIPLILFIFPCLLGVLILPAAYRISLAFAG